MGIAWYSWYISLSLELGTKIRSLYPAFHSETAYRLKLKTDSELLVWSRTLENWKTRVNNYHYNTVSILKLRKTTAVLTLQIFPGVWCFLGSASHRFEVRVNTPTRPHEVVLRWTHPESYNIPVVHYKVQRLMLLMLLVILKKYTQPKLHPENW